MRRQILANVARAVEEQHGTWNDHDKAVAKTAVLATVSCLLEYSINMSQELISVELYSEALVSGLLVNKLKAIKDET